MRVHADMTAYMRTRAHALVRQSPVGVVGGVARGEQGGRVCVLTAHMLVLQLLVRVVDKVARWMMVVGKVAGG